jgi:phosphatidylethanolamine/phosphatidyl-N-methylethanolamine N-methyltransferase
VLILGCGTGLDLELLPREADITAIDITPAMVEKTKQRAARLKIPIDARVMDGGRLEFPDESFDVVLLHLILAVVPDPVAVARESCRVLKRSGRVSILDKFLPDDRSPTVVRQLANLVTNTLFSDINRRLGPILDAASLRAVDEQPAFLGDVFKAVIAVKK